MFSTLKFNSFLTKIIKISFIFLKAILAIFISSALLLPVILAPLVTSTPRAIVIASYVAVIACVILPFRLHLRIKPIVITWIGFAVTSIFVIIASQVYASTPPILDSQGKPLTGSVATLEQVDLNGSKQWITIRGKDMKKPVLLYLGIGGPGAGGFPATFTSLKPLEDHFVVVNWDQPGTGKSYHSRDISTLTPQIVVDDAKALTNILKKRFNQKKIYVMGLSWGTILGINLIKQNPNSFYAYLGNGQMVNTVENDRFGYNLALKITSDKGDTNMHNLLKSYGPPPYVGKDMAIKFMDYNNVLFDYMGSPNIPMILALVPQLAKEYGYLDKLYFDLGLIRSFPVLYSQLTDLDFATQAKKLDVPIYFLVGEKDVNAVASIVERYYKILEAPYKELIWVKSGHGASAEEIADTFVNHVLVNSPPKEGN